MLVNSAFRACFLAPGPADSVVRIRRAAPPSLALDGCGGLPCAWLRPEPAPGSVCGPGSASVPGTLPGCDRELQLMPVKLVQAEENKYSVVLALVYLGKRYRYSIGSRETLLQPF